MTRSITLTGADGRTYVEDMVRLANLGAEIGLLYTFDSEGRNRYPSRIWLEEAAGALGMQCAVHICGTRARAELLAGNLGNLLLHVGRVQVNGIVSPAELLYLCRLYDGYHKIITQDAFCNKGLLKMGADNHVILVDGSGGTGRLPTQWARPTTDKPVGFAGGLGPDNLRDELPKIAAVAQGDWWVDMESGLRTDDWFDVSKAMRIMEIWREFQ